MPYGRPAAGGLGLSHRYVEVGWADPGGGDPASPGSFFSDFIEVDPQELFIARLNTQLTGADASGSAQLAFGVEDDAGGLNFTVISGPIPSGDGNSGGLIFELDLLIVGLATAGSVRVTASSGASVGPPLVAQPQPANNTGLVGWSVIALNANLLRIVIGAVSGQLQGNASGYIAKGNGG